MTLQEAIERARYNAANDIPARQDPQLMDWMQNIPVDEYKKFIDAGVMDFANNDYDVQQYQLPEKENLARLEQLKQKAGLGEYAPMQLYNNPYIWSAAAMLLLCLTGWYFLFHQKTALPPAQIVEVKPSGQHPPTVIQSNGTKGEMNISGADAEGVQDFVIINLSDTTGQKHVRHSIAIVHNGKEGHQQQQEYPGDTSTIIVPGGIRYKLILRDQSVVLLNAMSSIRYPTTQPRSQMQLYGEAYFDLKPDAASPFKVKTQYGEAEVLGTRFNVKTRPEEKADYITLLEGGINVKSNSYAKRPAPGHQVIIGEGTNQRYESVDTSDVTAWTQGYFGYKNVNIAVVLEEVARWYNLTIQYNGLRPHITLSFDGTRKVALKHLLMLLKSTGLRCELKGTTLIVN